MVCAILLSIDMHAGMLLDKGMDLNTINEMLKKTLDHTQPSVGGIDLQMVDFNYDKKNIKDLLNDYAEKLSLNIVYPPTEQITAEVTFNAGRKISIAQGWSFVKMILEQSGYSLIMKSPGICSLVPVSKIATEPLPLYIGVDFNQLPDSMERVRYIYYCTNISIPRQKQEMITIISNIIGANPQDKTSLQFEDNSNAIIFTTRADLIKSAMQLVKILDESGFEQAVEIVKLEHALAKNVVELFQKMIGGETSQPGAGFVSVGTQQRARVFSEMIKVLNLDPDNVRHLNSIVIIGKPTDIQEVRNFIAKYIDIAQEKGGSFFHVVELQWLQAVDFAEVLNNLTQAASANAQSTASANSSNISFDPHIKIIAESVRKTSSVGIPQGVQLGVAQDNGISNTVQRGANKLVIACSARDWERIQELIKQVDVPQKQVIIEALIMDLDATFVRKLGTQLRTQGITTSIFPKNMQAQAAMLTYHILGDSGPNADLNELTLTGDLADILNPDGVAGTGGASVLSQPQVSSSIPNPGSVGSGPGAFTSSTLGLITGGKARTGGAWAFFQLLSRHSSSKIFTRPVVMALNNQQVVTKRAIIKNLLGGVTAGTNPTVNYEQVNAEVTVKFTPIISSNSSINLSINLNMNLWADPDNVQDGTQFKRKIQTNVSLQSGDVLVLGGVMKERANVSKNAVPFFERIPVVGNFFSARNKDASKTQFFVVVRATSVLPREQGGMGPITNAAAHYMVEQLAETEDNFANLKDPITRWFFNGDRDGTESEYLYDKVHNLSKYDYGVQGVELEQDKPKQWHEKADHQGGNIRIGWFSDYKSQEPAASGPATDADMQNLSQLLQGMNNPFENRLNV